jgi:hypothetical protein
MYLISFDSGDLLVLSNGVSNLLDPGFQSTLSNGLGHSRNLHGLSWRTVSIEDFVNTLQLTS